MPYNVQIPGQVSEWQLKAIELVAALVPNGSDIVEIGSLFGRSSWAWARSVDPSVTLHCIDPWQQNAGIRAMEQRLGIKYSLEQFKIFTSDCENIVTHQGYSPFQFQDWSQPIRLFYEDAVHTNPTFQQNIRFWLSHLRNGIACGDDFRPRFPDIRNGVAELATELGRELITVECFWCLLPDTVDGQDTGPTKIRLRALSEAAAEAAKAAHYAISIDLARSGISNGTVTLVGSATNQNPVPIPMSGADGYKLLVRAVSSTGSSIVFQGMPPFASFDEDLPKPLFIAFPLESVGAEAATLHVGIADAEGRWFKDTTRGVASVKIADLTRAD